MQSNDQVVTTKHIGSSAMFTLCNMAKQKKLINATIKGIIQPMLQSQKQLKPQRHFYLRTKIKKALPHYDAHPDYEAFLEVMEDKDMLEGLDNEFDINDDDATKLATDLWVEVLRETDDYTDAIITM